MTDDSAGLAIIAANDDTALVRLERDLSWNDVAAAVLGSPLAGWQVRELNSERRPPQAGDVVAVPLRPVNPTSVYPDGYRTLPILCYHQFTHADRASHQLELSARDFEQQLQYLTDNDHQTLAMADVEAILARGEPIPDKAVALTIDDGYRSVYDVAWPLLQRYRARATLFIYPDFIGGGKALSWAQLREMAASGLVEVQSHGMSHASLTPLPGDNSEDAYRARLRAELSAPKPRFQHQLGKAPAYLSYPYGNSSETAIEELARAGYRLAATVTRGDNTVFTDPYLLHRTMIYDHHSLQDFRRFVTGFKQVPRR
ncbi:MAG: polysaccharide deacetylase family protein [Haliea sp.]|uniref:polysaccharide deacetylase family protein n=1 Tax=Haliea sp. TaxID=1932666 RepID=UPI0032EE4A67